MLCASVLNLQKKGYHIAKKNQFLKGEPNFNAAPMIVIGATFLFQLTYLKSSMEYVTAEAEAEEYEWDDWRLQREKTLSLSYLSAWIGIFVLTWFLIPVATHLVLLDTSASCLCPSILS
jgi:hypothetical protein